MTKGIAYPEQQEHVKPNSGGPTLPPAGPDGGGDGWERFPQGSRGPRELLHRYRLGLITALIPIFMLFIGLASAYLVRQGGGRVNPNTGTFVPDWQALTLPRILWLNTAMLIASSLTLEKARRALFHEPAVMSEWLGLDTPTRKRSLPWLSISLVLGLGFLAGQFLAWRELNARGLYLSSTPSSAFFFVLTGAHAAHLLGGIIALIAASAAALFGARLQSRQIAVDVTAWYWHAMLVLWLMLFALLGLAHG